MNAIRLLLTLCLLAFQGLSPALAAPDQLEDLRKEYLEARELLSATPKPQIGEEEFAAKLSMWSEIQSLHREAAKALVVPLVALAASGPADRFPAVRDELLGLHRDLIDGPTQACHDNLGYFSQVILPHVRDQKLPTDRAALFVKLTTPDEWVRGYDQRTSMGLPSEPTGLLIQDAHALAQARAGDFDAARKESDLLLKKGKKLLGGRLPDLQMNHGDKKRTKSSLQREFLLHRALIESLAGNEDASREHLLQAGKTAETDPDVLREQAALREQLGD